MHTARSNTHWYLCVLQLNISQVCANFMSFQIDPEAGLSVRLKQTSKTYRQYLLTNKMKGALIQRIHRQ